MDDLAGSAEVEMAYRLLLGRQPSASEIRHYTNASLSLQQLRMSFIRSAEFQEKLSKLQLNAGSQSGTKPLTWPALPIEVNVPAPQIELMSRHVERNWQLLGETEPHWSVVTKDAFKQDVIGANEEAFYNTGKSALLLLQAAANRCDVDLSKLSTCLELGCGVGRVTIWLAEMFKQVIAVDISQPHLTLAEAAIGKYARTNIELRKMSSIQQLVHSPNFDLFFSVIVLQHNPPPIIRKMLEQILASGNPGSVAYFQVPTFIKGYSFNAESYLEKISDAGVMEMHAIPQSVLYELFKKLGYKILEVREDGWTGSSSHISNSFLVQRG